MMHTQLPGYAWPTLDRALQSVAEAKANPNTVATGEQCEHLGECLGTVPKACCGGHVKNVVQYKCAKRGNIERNICTACPLWSVKQ